MKKALKIFTVGLLTAALCLLLCSCGSTVQAEELEDTVSAGVDEIVNPEDMFKNRDLNYAYDDADAVSVALKDDGTKCTSKNVSIKDNTVTISKAGVYLLSGSLSNGQIIVDAENEKVQLVLNNVNINCDTSAAIYCRQADKLYITVVGESSLSNSEDFVAVDDNNINAVVYSRDNLTFNGDGILNITAKYGHGASSKDNLKITGGTYKISAQKHALDANDSIRITDCTLDLQAQKDGIHASNDDDDTEGFVYIKDGEINISADDDGVHASSALKLEGGTVNISKCYEGLEGRLISLTGGEVGITASDDGINASNSSSNTNGGDSNQSLCGISISDGNYTVNADGDGIDSNGVTFITGGTVVVYGPENDGNGALDSDTQPQISGGTVVALGMSGMAVGFSEDSPQCSILYNLDSTYDSDTAVTLTDSKGNTVAEVISPKRFNSVVISSSSLELKKKYTLNVGEDSYKIKMSQSAYSNGNNSMPGGGAPQGNGGNPGGDNRQQPPGGERPSGQAPEVGIEKNTEEQTKAE